MTISLLSLEQRTYADERISGALDQIKNRLQSFSTVNNFLYKYNESDKVYFAQLVQVLFSSYSFAIKKNLYFHTEQATALSFDSAFWLGLIVNELLTNTGKARVSLDDITIAPTLFFGEAKGSFKILYFDSGDYYKKIPKICMPHGKTQGMGLKLIDLFSQRLKAKYENIDAQMVTKVTHSLNIPYDKFALAEDQRAVMLTIPC